jgi:hypothetical protein
VVCFFEFLTSFTFENSDFLISNLFLQLLVCQMCREGGGGVGFKLCLDTRKNRALTLDLAYMFGHQPVYPSNTKEWVIMGLFLAHSVNLLGADLKQVQ